MHVRGRTWERDRGKREGEGHGKGIIAWERFRGMGQGGLHGRR